MHAFHPRLFTDPIFISVEQGTVISRLNYSESNMCYERCNFQRKTIIESRLDRIYCTSTETNKIFVRPRP